MDVEFDAAKDAANIAKHGISLIRAAELDILVFVENSHPEDSERRFRLYGLLDGTPHCAVVTFRAGIPRAISLRKAKRTERKRHGL